MALIHRQTRIDSPRLVDWLLLDPLVLLDWVFSCLLEDVGTLLLQLGHIFLEKGLVLLILI